MEDAFGQALWDYHNSENESTYTTERDDGRRESAEIAHYFQPYDQWEDLTKEAMNYIRDGDSVLDVGCGAGRHTLWLQSLGHDVVAIDRSPLAIKTCEERGVEDCEVMSLSNLDFPSNSFDTVLVVGNILGLGGDVDSVKNILDEIARITTEDGRLIADTQDPFVDDEISNEYFQKNRLSNHKATSVRFRVLYDDLVEDWLEILLLGEEELKKIVSDSPWEVRESIKADPDEGWYSLKALWYYVVLDKS